MARVASCPHLHQADEPSQLVQELGDQVEPGPLGDRDVHLLVAIDEVLLLARLGKPALAAKLRSQVVEILIIHVVACVAHRHPLEGLAHSNQLGSLHWRQVAHDHLTPRAGFEQPFLAQGVEGVPDWSLRHPQRFGDRPFSKNRAGL
jgi:hypothetical protein